MPKIHTWVADGTHQTSEHLIQAFKHFSQLHNKIYISGYKKSVYRQVTASFTLVSNENY